MGLLDKIFSSTVSGVVKEVGEVVDKFVTTGQEKEILKLEIQKVINSHEEKLKELANTEIELQLKDIQDAREANTRIQESDKASWLSKNFAYFLDGAFCILFGVMLVMIFNKEVPADNKELFYTGFGLLGGIVGTVINFHRGSSKGSEKSGDTLRQIAKDK